MALSSGTKLGPYDIESLIGGGGQGEVYRARDTRLDRDVAIKVLPPESAFDPERRARFEVKPKLSRLFPILIFWRSSTPAFMTDTYTSLPNCFTARR